MKKWPTTLKSLQSLDADGMTRSHWNFQLRPVTHIVAVNDVALSKRTALNASRIAALHKCQNGISPFNRTLLCCAILTRTVFSLVIKAVLV